MEDIAAGRKSDAVDEFLKKYEIVPRTKENQSINNQNQEEMAKKNQTQQQAAPETGQQPKYRYNESMINWEGTETLRTVQGGTSGARAP